MALVSAAAVSDRGRVRCNNEDNFYVNGLYLEQEKRERMDIPLAAYEAEVQLFAVCDGIGGESYGELFSYMAARELESCRQELLSQGGGEALPVLERYLDRVNRLICAKNREHREKNGGTTIVLLCLCGENALCCNLGDSRCYFYREGCIRRISRDHTVLQRMKNMGIENYEERKMRRDGHTLTQYLGIPPEEMVIEPYVEDSIPVRKGDIFLLCSDGLTDMVTEEKMEEVIRREDSGGKICERLLNLALEAGGRDNVTVAALKILEV